MVDRRSKDGMIRWKRVRPGLYESADSRFEIKEESGGLWKLTDRLANGFTYGANIKECKTRAKQHQNRYRG